MKHFSAYKLFLDAKDIGIFVYPQTAIDIIKYLMLKLGYKKEEDIEFITEINEEYITMYGNLVKGICNPYPLVKLEEDEKYINLDVIVYIIEELQRREYKFKEIEDIVLNKIEIVDTLSLATR